MFLIAYSLKAYTYVCMFACCYACTTTRFGKICSFLGGLIVLSVDLHCEKYTVHVHVYACLCACNGHGGYNPQRMPP